MNVQETRRGLASTFTFVCTCESSIELQTSPLAGNRQLRDVNRRFPLAMSSIGRHYTQGKRFLGNMNIPPPQPHVVWARHMKAIHKATKKAANDSMCTAASDVKVGHAGTVDTTVS